MDFNHINPFGLANETPQCFLVMGSYRDNEVDSTHRLSSYLETFERCNTLQVTNIQLDGIAKFHTHLLISEMLGLPLRLTKSLTDAVQAKTLGNPLYINAFMQSLVREKLLVNSVSKKRWVWDIDAIKSVSIQESIAEVLTRKISYLPHDTQETLKVMSTFGSQISEECINHLYPEAKRQEFRDRLNSAVEESVIEKVGSKYKFVHDMVQQAVYELMTPKERGECHFQNGVKMISSLSSCDDSHTELGILSFAAIDQINIAKSFGATDTSMYARFAYLNLKAGERSMEVFNFISGFSYIEQGLSFMPKESKWNSSNYDLSRSLHEEACLACYVNALPAKANEYIEELLEKAQCLEHKLKAYYVMVKNLTSSGELAQALKKTFDVLLELGETFPAEVTPEIIQKELSNTKSLLINLTQESILSSPRLTDEKKLWAIKFMNNLSGPLAVTNYQLGPLIACRMVHLSSQYGYCTESAFGFLGYGQAQISVFEDVDEGYRWGKIALSLLESLGGKSYLPKMRCLFYSYVSLWKEPFQASSNILLHTHSEAMMVGDVEYASISAFFYCRQVLVCGQNLLLAEKECKAIASKMVTLYLLLHFGLSSSTLHDYSYPLSHFFTLGTIETNSNVLRSSKHIPIHPEVKWKL
jgi:predicted ATPase